MDILDEIETLDEEQSELENEELEELEDLGFDDEGEEADLVSLIDENDLEYEMSEDKAREVTEAIKAAATATYVLLAEAHRGKAYKALGYTTWADYVAEEFNLSTARSYQLLDLSKVVNEIEEASPEGTVVKLTEAQARDLKKELPRITEQVRSETDGMSPEDASEAVGRIVEDIREQKKADEKAVQEREKKVAEAEQEGYQRGLEAAADAMLEADANRGNYEGGDYSSGEDYDDDMTVLSPENKMHLYNFLNVLSGLTSLPEPEDFINVIPADRADDIEDELNAASAWLNRFSSLWELRSEG